MKIKYYVILFMCVNYLIWRQQIHWLLMLV